MTSRLAAVAASALLAASLSACGGTGRAASPRASASCAFVVEYDGRRYVATGYGVAPVTGLPLGQARLDGCVDAPGTSPVAARTVELAEVSGVPSDVAIAEPAADDAVRLLVREDLDYTQEAPRALKRLLAPPACAAEDEPVDLAGRWLGILGADGRTELDLVPPYDLRLFVESASSPRYDRALLTIRVPAEAGRPLSRGDIRSSLWHAGSLAVTARCRNGAFVAQQVEAHRAG